MSNTTKVLLEQRPATLIGRFLETMPDEDIRPIRDNAAVREEAASNVFPLIEAAWPGADPARLREAFLAVTRFDSNPDIITAKMTQRLKVQPGANLRAALEQFIHEIDICHTLMVQSWVRQRGIRPRFAEGDDVVATMRESLLVRKTYAGKITEIDHDMALYTVMTKEDGKAKFLTVPYEDVAGREQPVQEPVTAVASLFQDSE